MLLGIVLFRGIAREAAAEFLGTFVLIAFGVAVVAQVTLSQQSAGGYLSINLGWGLAVTLGAYVAGGVSGAHLNPAITLTLALYRGFSWRKVPAYIFAQFAGAFVASAVVYATYHEALDHFDGGARQVTGPRATAGIWATYPQPFVSPWPGGVIDQTVGTALLTLLIFALSDRRNLAPPTWFGPAAVGVTVMAIGMTFGFNAGYAINPARDFGPRLFTALAGWGGEVFRAGRGWWWVPIVGPFVGGALGGFVYELFIGRNHPRQGES